MLAWTVGVALVFVLLLIWSVLCRDSLRSRSAHGEQRSGEAGRSKAGFAQECNSERDAPGPGEPANGPPDATALTDPGAPHPAAGRAERAVQHAAGK